MDNGQCKGDHGRCPKPVQAMELCPGHYSRSLAGKPVDTPLRPRLKQDPELLEAGFARCSKCDTVKPLDQFPSKGNGAKRRTCSECENARGAQLRQANPDRTKANAKRARDKARAADPEGYKAKYREASKRWRANNPEKRNDATNAWYAKNPGYARAYHLKTKFNMTSMRYAEILASQEGRCAIRGCQATEPGGQGEWHVDHDHRCCPGKVSCGRCVRGLLCQSCNNGLGKFNDDSAFLRGAADYLDMWAARHAATAVEPPV